MLMFVAAAPVQPAQPDRDVSIQERSWGPYSAPLFTLLLMRGQVLLNLLGD
jgi:hypothetical protein